MARILVIDDEAAIRRVLLVALRLKGHEVIEAPTGKSALRVHLETPADLVITDINMPDIDGLEVINALRREDPRPKVIVMSGGGGPLRDGVFHVADLLGAFATVRKPFVLDVMLKVVDKALAA
jgi:DNA-binding NtrC family response regulator